MQIHRRVCVRLWAACTQEGLVLCLAAPRERQKRKILSPLYGTAIIFERIKPVRSKDLSAHACSKLVEQCCKKFNSPDTGFQICIFENKLLQLNSNYLDVHEVAVKSGCKKCVCASLQDIMNSSEKQTLHHQQTNNKWLTNFLSLFVFQVITIFSFNLNWPGQTKSKEFLYSANTPRRDFLKLR
jgi:hypothetical protein